jgi:hypothetical protein
MSIEWDIDIDAYKHVFTCYIDSFNCFHKKARVIELTQYENVCGNLDRLWLDGPVILTRLVDRRRCHGAANYES